MAIALTRFSQWMLRGDPRQKQRQRQKQKQKPRDERSTDFPSGFRESVPVKLNSSNFPLPSSPSSSSSSSSRSPRRIRKRRGTSKNNRIDREHDMVLVPSDGGACLSGSESDRSDWSIGWLEPHPHDFCTSDPESEDSFAVLVPCYRPLPTRANPLLETPNAAFGFGVGVRIPTREDLSVSESNEFLQHWLSSLASDPLV